MNVSLYLSKTASRRWSLIPSRRVFDDHAVDYDRWFDEHRKVYQAQVRMLGRSATNPDVVSKSVSVRADLRYRSVLVWHRSIPRASEDGKGPGGIEVILGEGEHIPCRTGSWIYVLMMTVICFLNDVIAVFSEANL